MKSFSLFMLMSIATLSCLHAHDMQPEHITLDSSFLELVDGKSYGIDASIFGCLLKIRYNLKKFLYGHANETKQCHFNNENFSIQEMARIELHNERVYAQKRQTKTALSSEEWNAIESDYTETKKMLAQSLEAAKSDFIEFILPFFDNVRTIKKQMVPLIEESCKKHKRTNSALPGCIQTEDGKEVAFFKRTVQSFKQLGFFCLDTIHFTTDMINSCPKAREQFEKLRSEKEGELQQSALDALS